MNRSVPDAAMEVSALQLSPRRREVLELVAKGLSNHEIARVLNISPGTARIHVSDLLSLLGVGNRTEAAAAWFEAQGRVERVDEVVARPAIAVLPFSAEMSSPEEQRIACAVSHDLARLFARWTWFPVISHGSPQAATTPRLGTKELGRRLGARYLVGGVIRASGAAWRLSATLDDAEEGCVLWAEHYDFPREDIFEAQDEACAQVVASAYDVLVKRLALRVAPARAPMSIDAWSLAHEGMLLQSTRASAATHAATTRFAAALERDPGLVLAHFGSGLCSYDGILNQWGDADAHAQALRGAAQRCLDLAPHAAEGHFLMGRYFQTRGDNAAAVGSLERAVGRNPSAAAAHALLAQVLVICGQDDEGLRRMEHATRLAPRAFVAGLAAFHFIRGDNERALGHAEQALLSNPHYTFARVLAAASAWDLGATDRAKVYAASLRALAPPFSPASFLRTFGGSVGVAAVERIARALHELRVGE